VILALKILCGIGIESIPDDPEFANIKAELTAVYTSYIEVNKKKIKDEDGNFSSELFETNYDSKNIEVLFVDTLSRIISQIRRNFKKVRTN